MSDAAQSNKRLIDSFYRAFAERDAARMIACYDTGGIRFSDPVFPDLVGEQVGAMWTMLTERAVDFHLTHRDVEADATTGRAHWTARYKFTKTNRQVINEIDASFVFKSGKIVEHRDQFDLWAWTGMALGVPGKLLGWSSFMQGKIRGQARAELDRFMAKRAAQAAP